MFGGKTQAPPHEAGRLVMARHCDYVFNRCAWLLRRGLVTPKQMELVMPKLFGMQPTKEFGQCPMLLQPHAVQGLTTESMHAYAQNVAKHLINVLRRCLYAARVPKVGSP